MEDRTRNIKSFAIRSSRMRSSMKAIYNEFYDKFCIEYDEKELPLKEYFAHDKIIVEIGFGMGDATIEIARKNINTTYIAIDVHKPGIAKILREINEKKLENIRVIEHDAVEVFEKMIPDGSLEGIHVFFPDPWPKKRHHKRRLIKDEFISLIGRKLKDGGYLYICTDWEDYAFWIMDVMTNQGLLKNKYDDFASHQEWRPLTKFEKKGLDKDHKIWEIMFVK